MIIIDKISERKNEFIELPDEKLSKKQSLENCLLNSSHWKEKKKEIYEKKIKVALKINSDEEFILGKTDLPYIKMIQINFLNFKDGRPFTLAKELRKKFLFRGEIRASGDVLPDQFVFLLRCGFDTVEIKEVEKDTWLELLEFDEGLYYQP